MLFLQMIYPGFSSGGRHCSATDEVSFGKECSNTASSGHTYLPGPPLRASSQTHAGDSLSFAEALGLSSVLTLLLLLIQGTFLECTWPWPIVCFICSSLHRRNPGQLTPLSFLNTEQTSGQRQTLYLWRSSRVIWIRFLSSSILLGK